MKQLFIRGIAISASVYTLLNFITIGIRDEILQFVLSLVGISAFLFSCLLMPVKQLFIPLFLTIAAFIIAVISNASLLDLLLHGFLHMKSLIVLILIVPMISWVLKEEPYIDAIMTFAHKFLNTSKKFYFGMMMTTQIIAYFILFAAIPMIYQFISQFLKDKREEGWENYKSTAILRGFSLATMWVISIPSFVFAVETLGASLWKSIMQGFCLSFCGIIVAIFYSHLQEKKYRIDVTAGLEEHINHVLQQTDKLKEYKTTILEFGVIFVSLFGTIFLLHAITSLELLQIIPFVIIAWSLLYFIVKKRVHAFKHYMFQYFSKGIGVKAKELSLLLGASALIYSVNQSSFGDIFLDGIFYITNAFSYINILMLLPFVVIFLGLLGLGPLTVIVLVAGIIQTANLPYPPELILLSITSGSAISSMLSPFILPVIVLSAENGLSVVKNGFQFNFFYGLTIYLMTQLYIQLALTIF